MNLVITGFCMTCVSASRTRLGADNWKRPFLLGPDIELQIGLNDFGLLEGKSAGFFAVGTGFEEAF